NMKVNGSSFDIKRMNTTFNLDVLDAYLQGYNYNKITGLVTLSNGSATIVAQGTDPNLAFGFNGLAYLNKDYPEIDAQLAIRNIDFQALCFIADTMKLAGYFAVQLPVLNVDYPQANIVGTEMELTLP